MSTFAPTAAPALALVTGPSGRTGLEARTDRAVRPARPGVVPAAGAAVTPRLVLTRRGRRSLRLVAFAAVTTVLAVGLVLLWLAVAAVVAPGAVAGDGSPGVRSGATSVEDGGPTVAVVVQQGDTLWQIARTHAPGRDPRAVVDDVVRLNDLPSTGVQAGEQLLVPTA